jgi:hypothetical protein
MLIDASRAEALEVFKLKAQTEFNTIPTNR